MEFRDYLAFLKKTGALVEIERPCSTELEIACEIKAHDGHPIMFRNVKGHTIPVVAGLFGFRGAFSIGTMDVVNVVDHSMDLLHEKRIPATDPRSFINKLYHAIEGRKKPERIAAGRKVACQEIIDKPGDLGSIPILKHLVGDAGRYITSDVAIYTCPKYGRNISMHRLLVLGSNKMVARTVENRGLDTAIKEKKGEPLEAALVIGNSSQVLLAASTSPPKGVDELSIANAISPFKVVKCQTIDVEVPVDSEIVIEGRFLPERVDEGPFLDLTGTFDIVRKQPVFEVTCITRRKDAIYHALNPAGMEHQLLMGLPREATMLAELTKLGNVKDVRVTAGSSHWFNAVVQVDKGKEFDPEAVIQACFKGHGSLKNCTIVDDDIDIDNPNDVEFAVSTRAQFDKNLYLYPKQQGSSLDPSSNQVTRETCKVGINATVPRGGHGAGYNKNFSRISYCSKE
jgi:2,5-furandicarboxylate decarboxylase 1